MISIWLKIKKYITFLSNRRFLIGMILLIANFVVGKLALFIIPIDVMCAAVIYGISWVMLFAGLFMCGREGYYLSKIFYQRMKASVKENTRTRLLYRKTNADNE